MSSVTSICNKSLRTAGTPEQLGWGIQYRVDSEIDAFRIAYLYRNSPHGVKVDRFELVNQYAITIFSANCPAGIDRS
jgi:hypothetical protein